MRQLSAAFRSVWRSILFLGLAACALVAVACPKPAERLLPSTRRRARWLRLWSGRLQSIIGLQVECRGRPPTRGMLVCNHLSYLDMLALTSAGEMVFLSKIEVGGWPLIGQIARASGALFVNRSRRGDVADLEPEFVAVIEQGVVLTMFPEGTSSGGGAFERKISSGCPERIDESDGALKGSDKTLSLFSEPVPVARSGLSWIK